MPEGRGGLLYPPAAALVVYGCIRSELIARFLSRKFGKFVGSISFPIYILHVPIIYTVFASVGVLLYPSGVALGAWIIVTIVGMVGLAYAAEIYVERAFLIRLGRLRVSLRELDPFRRRHSRILE